MKKRFFYLLLLPVMAFSISSCDKNKVSVTPDEVTFECDGGTKTVMVNLGDNTYYDARVDEDGRSWCTVECPGDGVVNITVRNNTGEVRTCYVNCYVAPSEGLTEEEMTKLPILVTQDAYKIVVTEPTFVRFNFETNAQTDLIWDYDGGGHMTFSEMLYLWHRAWDEMNVSHTNDTLTFWTKFSREHEPSNEWYQDRGVQVSIMITGFAEPYDHCEVNTVTFYTYKTARNSDPNDHWQLSEYEGKVIMAHIPLKSHNINVNGKTGTLYFRYEDENMQVLEGYFNDHGETKYGNFQNSNKKYVGSDRDLGEVEVNFNLK